MDGCEGRKPNVAVRAMGQSKDTEQSARSASQYIGMLAPARHDDMALLAEGG